MAPSSGFALISTRPWLRACLRKRARVNIGNTAHAAYPFLRCPLSDLTAG